MAVHKPRPRFLALLRRAAKTPDGAAPAPRNASEDNALWLAHERASERARDAGDASQRLASSLAKQRGAIDGVADRLRLVSGRAAEVSTAVQRMGDAFDRLTLVALNAGLEGARLGETAGRALLIVAEEVRGNASRGSDAVRDLSGRVDELAGEIAQLQTHTLGVRDTSADVAQDAARTAGASADVGKALFDLGEHLRQVTGSDPDTVRAVADAAEHARALVAALNTLSASAKIPRALLVSALRPILAPVVGPVARLLAESQEPSGGDAPSAP